MEKQIKNKGVSKMQDENQITDAEKLRMAKFTDILIKSKEIAEYE
jgi:hypothetical protein